MSSPSQSDDRPAKSTGQKNLPLPATMKFADLSKYNKYSYIKSAQPVPVPLPPPVRRVAPPPQNVYERPAPKSTPPAYSDTAVESQREVARVELKVDIGTGHLSANRSTHRWSERVNLGTEIILIHKGYALADVHCHMLGLFSAAIGATVKGPRAARYFVCWEPLYRVRPHRLAITNGNWKLVLDLLFTQGAHLGEDFARKVWIEVHVSTAAE